MMLGAGVVRSSETPTHYCSRSLGCPVSFMHEGQGLFHQGVRLSVQYRASQRAIERDGGIKRRKIAGETAGAAVVPHRFSGPETKTPEPGTPPPLAIMIAKGIFSIFNSRKSSSSPPLRDPAQKFHIRRSLCYHGIPKTIRLSRKETFRGQIREERSPKPGFRPGSHDCCIISDSENRPQIGWSEAAATTRVNGKRYKNQTKGIMSNQG